MLSRCIDTCYITGIDKFIIDKNSIRGMADDMDSGIFLLQKFTESLTALEFDSIGIGRVGVLKTRLNLMDQEGQILFVTRPKGDSETVVSKLILKGKKTTVEYSCTDPVHIKAPKNINDEFVFEFDITQDTIKIMSKIISAISVDHISFSSEKDGSVRFKATDSEGDLFNHMISESYISTESDNFFFSYKIKLLLPLLKNAFTNVKNLHVTISKRGYLQFKINDLNIYILSDR
jgi:hypothetical protein